MDFVPLGYACGDWRQLSESSGYISQVASMFLQDIPLGSESHNSRVLYFEFVVYRFLPDFVLRLNSPL